MLTYTVGPNESRMRRFCVSDAMKEAFGHNWDVNPVGSSDFRMEVNSVAFGDLRLTHATFSQAEVTNTKKTSSKSDHPYNIYFSNKRHTIVTSDQTIVLEPGDITVVDPAMASVMTTKQPYTTIGLTVPADILLKYIPNPEQVVGIRFSGKTGFSKIVSHLLHTMWEFSDVEDFEEIGTDLANNLLGILSTCCQINRHHIEIQDTGMLAKQDMIRQVIDRNIRMPDLCLTELAKQCGFSVRYIQRLFAEEDCTVSKYIRRKRLSGCKKQLADPAWLNRTITEIAFSWGFNSSAHFARVFREQYGINAREFRKQALMGLSYYKDTGSSSTSF